MKKTTLRGRRDEKLFLGIAAAAHIAGVSTRHFYRIIAEDHIRTIRIGRKFFILSSDFAHWAKGKNIVQRELGSQLRAGVVDTQ